MLILTKILASATHKIEEFVIVIDTSMSCSGDLVRKFLEETYHILAETESFFRKVHIRILQCDDAVRADQLITTGEVAENIGSDDAEKLIADVKQKVAEDNLSSPSEIKQAIEESANDLNISLSDADKEKIQNLMDKISDLDLNVSQLKEQAKDLYDKLNNSGILEKITAFFRSVVKWIGNLFGN